jgi:hypothetical protein
MKTGHIDKKYLKEKKKMRSNGKHYITKNFMVSYYTT